MNLNKLIGELITMGIHRLSILGYGIGVVILIASIIRWFFIWYDVSQAILGAGIGVLVLILSYIYGWMRNIDSILSKYESRMDSIVMWWTKQEKEEVHNKARGIEND